MKTTAVLPAALLGAALLTGPANPVQAAEPTVEIVSPAVGADVSGTVPVDLSSAGTPFVRLGIFSEHARPDRHWFAPVAVSHDGTASVDLPTWGFTSMVLEAQPCATASPDSCTTTSVRHQVKPTNGPPVVEEPTHDILFEPGVDGPLVFRGAGAGPGLGVRVTGALIHAQPGVDLPVDLTDKPDGDYGPIIATWCNPVFVEECNGGYAAGPNVLIRRSLPAQGALDRTRLSPNGDGRFETTGLTLSMDRTLYQRVQWSVVRGSKTVAGPYLLLGWVRGDETTTLDLYRRMQRVLPSGGYDLVLDFDATPLGHHFHSQQRLPIVVDTTPVTLHHLTPSHRVFYPRRDGYRDRVTVTGTADGSATTTSASVVTLAGRVVRHLPATVRVTNGAVHGLRWNGRDDDGALVPEGRYRFRITTTDDTGNRATTVGATVTVSHHRR